MYELKIFIRYLILYFLIQFVFILKSEAEIRSLRDKIKKLEDELMATKSELEQQKIVILIFFVHLFYKKILNLILLN